MNFKDLREANLSKAQINKVHDKADDLPKSDFIKRYGKEGDAVRFATATNMVKKQLGIAEAAKPNRRGTEINVLELTFSNSGDAKKAEDWIDSSAWSSLVVDYEQSRNTVYMQGVTDPGGNVSPRGPGLQGALKAAGFKFRVTEEDTSDYDEMDEANESLDKEDEKSIGDVIKGLKKAVKSHQGQVKSLTKDIKDEVKLDEVHFSNRGETPAPKGMHKLRSGRDIPSSPQVDKIHKKVVKMTDRNDHFGAKIEIAKACGDKKLVQIYNALELMHDKYGVVGNKSIELRQIFEPVLNNAIDRKFGKYADVIRDAT